MIKFNKPENLNGLELLEELAAIGIVLDLETQPPFVDGNGDLWLHIEQKDAAKAAAVVKAHNGNVVAKEPSVSEKLASVGLNLDDLKSALGL